MDRQAKRQMKTGRIYKQNITVQVLQVPHLSANLTHTYRCNPAISPAAVAPGCSLDKALYMYLFYM